LHVSALASCVALPPASMQSLPGRRLGAQNRHLLFERALRFQQVEFHPLVDHRGGQLVQSHAVKPLARVFFNGTKLIAQGVGLLVMQDQQDAPAALQAVDGHHIGWYALRTHRLTNAHDRVNMLEFLLDAGMGFGGNITQCR